MENKFNGFINLRYTKFVIDDKGKRPFDKGRPTPTYSLDEVFTDWNGDIAFKVPEGMVVVDSDTQKEAEIILNCIREKKLKCIVSKSTRGYHFFFRMPADLKRFKNNSNNSIPLGLVDIDYKTGFGTNWMILYRNGKWDEFIPGYEPKIKKEGYAIDPFMDLDELPYWLIPLKSPIVSFVDMKEGDGRNDALNAHRTRLVCQNGYNQQQVFELFELINDFVFAEPLTKSELDTLATFREMDRKKRDERWFDDKGHFQHNLLGDYLIKLMYCYKDPQRRVWYFNDKFFSSDDYVLEQKIVEVAPELQTRQRNEVINYIKLTDIKSNVIPDQTKDWICCNNMLVEGSTGNTIGHTPSIFVNNLFDVEFDSQAYDENVDKFLNEVLVECGDKEQRMIFEEYLGYTIFSSTNFMKKMLICIGTNANNGKSTLFKLVKSLMNSSNYSSVKLEQINEKNIHVIPKLVDKIANFDDEGPTSLDDSAVTYLKTIISDGNEITVNPKFKEPYQTFIKAKLWTNTNHIIKTPQKGQEWMTRLLILSFNNIFEGKKQDPKLFENKLSSPKAKAYLLKLALEGYQRLIKNNRFTISPESEKWIKQYRIENDNVYNFLYTKRYSLDQFIVKDPKLGPKLLKSVYEEYRNDCEENDVRPMNMNNFGKRLLEYFNNQLKLEVINNQWVIEITREEKHG